MLATARERTYGSPMARSPAGLLARHIPDCPDVSPLGYEPSSIDRANNVNYS